MENKSFESMIRNDERAEGGLIFTFIVEKPIIGENRHACRGAAPSE